jgi:hypothetical protein
VNLNSSTISKKTTMMSCFFVTKTHTLIATSVYTLRMFVLSRCSLLSCSAKTDLPNYQHEEEAAKFIAGKKTDSSATDLSEKWHQRYPGLEGYKTHPHRNADFRSHLVKIMRLLLRCSTAGRFWQVASGYLSSNRTRRDNRSTLTRLQYSI